ncbi:ABC transporter ATP-binding protein [Cellulomonas sp. Y8]|uniref:ABC transporter ATP-binding protein n=1 Tax=Cellulomonas sp. Y8 TaxID=2591145 RepID=UPI003D7319DF
MTSVVELRDVVVEHQTPAGPVRALDSLTVSIGPASTTAIHGRSGAGKSTLISVLALLRRPTKGRVIVGGDDITDWPQHQLDALRPRQVGIAFQSPHLDDALTAAENVLLPWVLHAGETAGLSRRQARNRVVELLEMLGVGELARRRPSRMSGGQRQRVAVARAMFTNPRLLLADEPTGNLDEESANDVASSLFALAGQLGTAVVVVTHDRAIADMASDQVQLARGAATTSMVR